MFYDPIKDRLGAVVSRRPFLQKAFFLLLNIIFLRAWYVRREVRRLLGESPRGRRIRVLDAGTGFGQYAYFIAKEFPDVEIVAIDVKQDYLDNARRFLDQTTVGARIELRQEDLTRLSLEGPFDLILSVDVMEHIEDDRAVFRHFARVLSPGGHVVINTPSDLGGSDVSGGEEGGFIEEHVRPGYGAEELRGKLKDAGLRPVRAIYTYGTHGSRAWRLLVKWPMLLLGHSRFFFAVLPLYYLAALPVGSILNALDLRSDNDSGTGLLMVATLDQAPNAPAGE